MFSFESASTSPEALVHDTNIMSEWHTMSALRDLKQEIQHDLQTLVVGAEHTLESIAEHFGIYHFGHNLANKNLLGCKLLLHPHGILEIQRPGVTYSTSFPVIRREMILA